MRLARLRTLFFLAFVACASILGAAVYLEHDIGPTLCPLCLVQQAIFALYGVVCLIAVFQSPGKRGWQFYSAILLVLALTGAGIAGRQVFLQASPPEDMAACLAQLQFLLNTQPYLKVFGMTLAGSAGCSEITWSLFGISIPEWSLLAFAAMSLFALYYLVVEFRRFGSTDSHSRD